MQPNNVSLLCANCSNTEGIVLVVSVCRLYVSAQKLNKQAMGSDAQLAYNTPQGECQ